MTDNPHNLPATRGDKLSDLIAARKPDFAQLLPGYLTPDRFVKLAHTALSKSPTLAKCTASSILVGLMTIAEAGLEPGTREAYLVPFKNRQGSYEAQVIIGYPGLLKLCRQHEDVRDILPPQLVYEKDTFRYRLGDRPGLEHEPYLGGDRGEVLGAYLVGFMVGSDHPHITWMSRADLDKIKAQALRGKHNPAAAPWNTHEEEMQRKTVLRRGSKYFPQTFRLRHAIDVMDAADTPGADMVDAIDVSYQSIPAPDPSPEDDLKDRLRARVNGVKQEASAPAEDAAPSGSSSVKKACRWGCGETYTARGLTRHENKCRANPANAPVEHVHPEESVEPVLITLDDDGWTYPAELGPGLSDVASLMIVTDSPLATIREALSRAKLGAITRDGDRLLHGDAVDETLMVDFQAAKAAVDAFTSAQ